MCTRPPVVYICCTEVRLSFCNYTAPVKPFPGALERVDIKVCRRSHRRSAIGDGYIGPGRGPSLDLGGYAPSSEWCAPCLRLARTTWRGMAGVGGRG